MGTSSISYFFKSSVRSIKKNFVMSLASASVLIACMLIIGTVFLISQNISNFMDSVEKQNEIIAFIDENVGEDELNSLKEELSAIDNIKNITDNKTLINTIKGLMDVYLITFLMSAKVNTDMYFKNSTDLSSVDIVWNT